MSTPTFDTFQFVERLEQAGMPRAQAAALAQAQKDLFAEAAHTTLATKLDIRDVRDDLIKVERRMDALEARLDKMQWMLGLVIALAVANFAKQFF